MVMYLLAFMLKVSFCTLVCGVKAFFMAVFKVKIFGFFKILAFFKIFGIFQDFWHFLKIFGI